MTSAFLVRYAFRLRLDLGSGTRRSCPRRASRRALFSSSYFINPVNLTAPTLSYSRLILSRTHGRLRWGHPAASLLAGPGQWPLARVFSLSARCTYSIPYTVLTALTTGTVHRLRELDRHALPRTGAAASSVECSGTRRRSRSVVQRQSQRAGRVALPSLPIRLRLSIPTHSVTSSPATCTSARAFVNLSILWMARHILFSGVSAVKSRAGGPREPCRRVVI